MNAPLVCSVIFASFLQVLVASPWRLEPNQEERCLIACGKCFMADEDPTLLMECANLRCIEDLHMGKPLGALWRKACPMLAASWHMPKSGQELNGNMHNH